MNTVIVAVYSESFGVKIITAIHQTPESAVKDAKERIDTLSEVIGTHLFSVRINFESGVCAVWDATRKGIILENGGTEEIISLIKTHYPPPYGKRLQRRPQ